MLKELAVKMAEKEIRDAKKKKTTAKRHPVLYIAGAIFGYYFFQKGLRATTVEVIEKITDKKEESDKKIEERVKAVEEKKEEENK